MSHRDRQSIMASVVALRYRSSLCHCRCYAVVHRRASTDRRRRGVSHHFAVSIVVVIMALAITLQQRSSLSSQRRLSLCRNDRRCRCTDRRCGVNRNFASSIAVVVVVSVVAPQCRSSLHHQSWCRCRSSSIVALRHRSSLHCLSSLSDADHRCSVVSVTLSVAAAPAQLWLDCLNLI